LKVLFVSKLPIWGLVALPLLGTIYAGYLWVTSGVSTFDLTLCIVLAVITEYGVTFGYHRLVVHKAFEPNPVLKAIVLGLGSMAFQGPVVHWASVHTKHHAYSDQEGDPHSPTVSGFLYAHFEWLIEMNSKELGTIIDKWGGRYLKDPMIAWFSKTFLYWSAFSLILPAALGYAVGGWAGAGSAFLWGGLVRIFLTSHVTWSVNSVCHYFGARMFTTTDKSRNNPIIGLLALGEGWHNNHHAFPASAFHGMRWWQIDLTGLSIRLYEALGLVKKVVRIPESLQIKRAEQGKVVALDVQHLAMTEDGPPLMPEEIDEAA
jgi:stearoyl-CoA desaturase (delta-9 desaturase)